MKSFHQARQLATLLTLGGMTALMPAALAGIPTGSLGAVSNLDNPTSGGVRLDALFENGTPVIGSQFTTGTEATTLRGVRVPLETLQLTDSASLAVAIFSNIDAGNPVAGSLLTSLTLQGSLSGTASSVYSFLDPLETALSPNTIYWLVLNVQAPDNSFRWAETADPSETVGLPGWSIADGSVIQTDDEGGFSTSPAVKYAIDVVAVPEASTVAAGLMLAGGMGGMLWRRRRSA